MASAQWGHPSAPWFHLPTLHRPVVRRPAQVQLHAKAALEAVLRFVTAVLTSTPAKIVSLVLLAPFALFWFAFLAIQLFLFAPLVATPLPDVKERT